MRDERYQSVRNMGIKVEVDKVILSGEPFDVTFSMADGENVGTFDMTLEIDGARRTFALRLGSDAGLPVARCQIVQVDDETIWTVLDWGTATPGSMLEVKLIERAEAGARSGSDRAAVMPESYAARE